MSIRRLALWTAASLGLAGMTFAGMHADAAGPATIDLGQNLAGERCVLAARPTLSDSAGILCAGESENGQVSLAVLHGSLPQAKDEALAMLARVARSASQSSSSQSTCNGGEWIDEQTALVTCQSPNSWPELVVIMPSGANAVVAEGAPSQLPVLIAAAGSVSARPVAQAVQDGFVEQVRKRFPDSLVKASSTDVSKYKSLIEEGRLAASKSDYSSAEDNYRQALDIETGLFGANSSPVGQTLIELALQVSNQGRADEAKALFQRATPILEASPNEADKARLAAYLALDAANGRRFDEALKYARQATAILRSQDDASADPDDATGAAEANRAELVHSLRIEAAMALRLGDTASARAAGEESLWIMTQEPGLPLWWRPELLSLMGDINEQMGRVVPAEHNLRDARELDIKIFGENGGPTAAADLRLGQFYSGQQLYDAAIDAYRSAFALLAHDRIARSRVVPEQIVPFLEAVAASSDPAKAKDLNAQAFLASQFIASGVRDQIIARVAARRAVGDPELAGLLRQLDEAQRARDVARIEAAAENAKSDEDRSAARLAKLNLDLKAASARADDISARIAQSHPDYAALSDPGEADLSAFQAALSPGEAFVNYVIGNRGGYGIFVTADSFVLKKLDTDATRLAGDVSDLRRAVEPGFANTEPFSLKNSYALYQEVLAPFASELKSVRHLVVAPTGALQNLPFDLLVTNDEPSDYAHAAWLIRDVALSEAPSPRAFLALVSAASTASRAPQKLLGVGNPLFSGTAKAKTLASLSSACMDGGPIAADTLRGLPPLPETAGELETAARALGAGEDSLLLGSAATEANVRAHTLSDYAVLYFATHGLLPGELHCQSEPALALSPAPGTTSTATDGLLTTSEISALKLDADLVVLSACNTAASGDGKFGGASLEGLADAFFSAGARAVLASHWQIPSRATQTLMTDLFRQLGNRQSMQLAEALRQAQLSLIATPETANPYNWAAFTLIGAGGGNATVANGSITTGEGRS